VIGDPVEHSLSPQIHNAAFRETGLDFSYVAFHVKKGETENAIRGMRGFGIRGLSVTIPHKVDIVPYLDSVDEIARNVGSINTVVNDEGHLTGFSTDGPGALRALRAGGCDPKGQRVLLLGSGGAARAIAFSLATISPAPELTILGVEVDELSGLRTDLLERTPLTVVSLPYAEQELRDASANSGLIINATPLGMTPNVDVSPLAEELITVDHTVFDIVYTPFETKLLRGAKAAGAQAIPGIGMFVQQAAIQFELWTGRPAPLSVMTRTVTEALA
jgi:shikimate dehydrogenase